MAGRRPRRREACRCPRTAPYYRLADGRQCTRSATAHVTAVALVVYTEGRRALSYGRAWVNVDLVWAGALILTGFIALVT